MFELAREQYETSQSRAAELERPCVVIDWRHQLSSRPGIAADGWDYVARNIGPGRAFNVVFVLDYQTHPSFYPLGTLDVGDTVRMPQGVIGRLNQDAKSADRAKHLVVSTPPSGQPWTLTTNRVDRDNRITHVVSTRPASALEAQAVREGAFVEMLRYVLEEDAERQGGAEQT